MDDTGGYLDQNQSVIRKGKHKSYINRLIIKLIFIKVMHPNKNNCKLLQNKKSCELLQNKRAVNYNKVKEL
jgi:hypothetical protein